MSSRTPSHIEPPSSEDSDTLLPYDTGRIPSSIAPDYPPDRSRFRGGLPTPRTRPLHAIEFASDELSGRTGRQLHGRIRERGLAPARARRPRSELRTEADTGEITGLRADRKILIRTVEFAAGQCVARASPDGGCLLARRIDHVRRHREGRRLPAVGTHGARFTRTPTNPDSDGPIARRGATEPPNPRETARYHTIT